MWHVLEHVESPREYLTEIKRILAPNGMLLIGVPNAVSLQAKIGRLLFPQRKYLYADFGEHTYHFSRRTLKNLLNKIGFKVTNQKVYWGSREREQLRKSSNSLKDYLRKIIFYFPNSGGKQSIIAYKNYFFPIYQNDNRYNRWCPPAIY